MLIGYYVYLWKVFYVSWIDNEPQTYLLILLNWYKYNKYLEKIGRKRSKVIDHLNETVRGEDHFDVSKL